MNKKITKKVIEKEIEKVEPKLKNTNKRLEDFRNSLISEIKPKLLSNGLLKRGGSEARRIHQHEMYAYTGVINEINAIGKELGLAPVSLGRLRKG